MDAKKSATIHLIEKPDARAVLNIGLPPGTPLKSAPHVLVRIDEIIQKLTGCPCNSGVDIHIRDSFIHPEVAIKEIVNVVG